MTPPHVKAMFASLGSRFSDDDLTDVMNHLGDVDVDEVAELVVKAGLEKEFVALVNFYTSVVRHINFERN